MKKIIILYIICIVSLFLLPVFLVKEYEFEKEEFSETDIKIKLLYSEKNEIEELTLDEYIMGVLIGEMPVDYNLEALKAQAVVARTYTLNKIINYPKAHENADMCDDINHCQAYKTKEYAFSCWNDNEEIEKWNKIKKAVFETSNIVITYNNELINAFFHANSGGKTEDISNIWGRENIPYLKSVEGCEVDEFIDEVILTQSQLNNMMKQKYSNYEEIKFENISDEDINSNESSNKKLLQKHIKILEKNSSGRVEKLQISNIIMEGTEARSILGLRSTMFEIRFEDDSVIFNTKGYGHGIGMSQYGANDIASSGKTYEEIIKHYYTGVEIKELK